MKRNGLPHGRRTAFEDCGAYPWVAKTKGDDARYVVVSNRCRDRFCPSCARIKANTIAENLSRHVQQRQLRFITFTLKAGELPLQHMLNKLYDSFRKLRANKVWKHTQAGGASFLEVKIGKTSGTWHPHLHVLCEGKFVRVQELRKVWERITGGSHQVWVELVRNREAMARYVTKYVAKPFDPAGIRSQDHLDEALICLSGTHSALTFGTWRGLRLCERIHDQDFEYLCSFAELKRDAHAGDRSAILIWNAIAIAYKRTDKLLDIPEEARPPPPKQPAPQLTLFETSPDHWLHSGR